MSEWAEKSVLVTGAGSGIGKSTAIEFALLGATVFVADIDFKSASNTAEYISSTCKKNSIALQVDVSNKDSVKAMFETIANKTNKIDSLINNVGIEISGDLTNFSLEKYNKLFDINVKSLFLCSQGVVAFMKQDGGSIVNLASVASFKTWANDGAYSATKAAVASLTKGFALDFAKHNIRVNAVAPAIIDTPMTDRAIEEGKDMAEEKRKKGLIHPLKRIGTPKEIADAIIFLASNKSSFTTGSILIIDGGLLA